MSSFVFLLLWPECAKSELSKGLSTFPFEHEVIDLNERWGCLLPDFDLPYLARHGPERDAVLTLSRSLPFLFYYHSEDHGWGYEILAEGRSVASCDVDYELAWSLGLEMNPALQSAFESGEMDKAISILETVRQTERFRQKVAEGLSRANPEAFARFGLEPTTIEKLRELLTVENVIRDDGSDRLVLEFRKLIGLNEGWDEPTL